MHSGWERLGRLLAILLFGGGAGCGGNVAVEGDPDAAPTCTHGVQALITGELEGTSINAVFDLRGTGLSRRGERWAMYWPFEPLGHAIATGVGADGDEVETSFLFVTPQTPPFEGAIFTAVARLRVAPFETASLTALRRVGWCPGSPIDGELTYCSDSPGCPVGAPQPGSALVVGRLDGTPVHEPAWVISNVQQIDASGGVLRVSNGLSNAGLVLVEGPAERSSGVIAFPETGTSKAVLCVEQLSNRLTMNGIFHATALSLAGERPGEPVSGELTLRTCLN